MKFRKMTNKTETTETRGPKTFRTLLLAGGILGACVLVAAAVFALREITTGGSDDDASVAESVGTEGGRSISDALDDGGTAASEPPPLSATDLKGVPGVNGPPLEQLLAESAEGGQLERVACGNIINVGGGQPQEPPLCADGFPEHGISGPERFCASSRDLPVAFEPILMNRWPGWPTTSTLNIAPGGGLTPSVNGPQEVWLIPVAYWQDEYGKWQAGWGDWFQSYAHYARQNAEKTDWWIWRNGTRFRGDELRFDFTSGGLFSGNEPQFIAGGLQFYARTIIQNHPGHSTYYYRVYYYWGPIKHKTTGQTLFSGRWLQQEIGWRSC